MTDPTITPAQPLPFNEWITRKGTTVPGPDEYRDYVDYANTELLRNGLYDDQLAAEIKQEVANLAAESGVTADPNDYLRARRPDQDFDLLTRRAIEIGDDDMGDAVRTYQAVKGSRDIYDDEVEYQRKLEEARLAAEPFLDPERVNDARRAALDRGDLPFVVIDQGGGKPPLIQFGPAAADIQTDEDLAAAFDANPDLDRRFIGAVRQKIQPLPGFDAPAWALDRQMDFQAAAAQTKVTDTERYRLMVRDIANGNTDAFNKTLADLSTDPAFASFTQDERRNFLMDMAKMQGQPEVDPQNVAASLRTLSTGQVHIPDAVMFNKGYFDQALQAVPEGQRQSAQVQRQAHMEAVAPEKFALLSEFSPDFVDAYEQAKAAGKSNGEILDEWMSNPDNHSKFWTRARGLTMGAVSAVTDIPVSLAALAGSEGARDILVENQRRESARKQYATLFGDKLGVGYDAVNLIAPVGVDLTLAAAAGPTAGATAGLLAAKTGAKAVVKSALRRSLSAETKTLLSQFTRKAAARQATRQGLDTVTTPISTSAVLSLAGRDFAQTVSRSAVQATVLGTAFTRSAGSTYASLHATLSNERNADGSPRYTPEQVREIALGHGLASGAITASVVGAFQFLGAAGVERLLSGGFTPAQARQIHARLKINPAIAKQYGVDLASPEKMIESAVRNATTNFLRAGVEEGGEEFVDQMAQSVNEALATGERFDVVKATKDALYAGTLGFAMGAGMTGAQRLAGRPLGEDRLQLERRSTLLQLANKFDAHSPNTAAALRAAAAEPPPAPAQKDVPAPPAAGGPEQAPSDAGVAPAPEGQVTPEDDAPQTEIGKASGMTRSQIAALEEGTMLNVKFSSEAEIPEALKSNIVGRTTTTVNGVTTEEITVGIDPVTLKEAEGIESDTRRKLREQLQAQYGATPAAEAAAPPTEASETPEPEAPAEIPEIQKVETKGRARMAERILVRSGVDPESASVIASRIAADVDPDGQMDPESFRSAVLKSFDEMGGESDQNAQVYNENPASYSTDQYGRTPEQQAELARQLNQERRDQMLRANRQLAVQNRIDPETQDIANEVEQTLAEFPAPAGTPTESLPTDMPTSGDVGTAVQQELPGTEQPRQRTLSGMRDAVNRRLDEIGALEEPTKVDIAREKALFALLGRIEAKMLRDNAEGADAVRARYASAVPGQTVTADAPREVREVMEVMEAEATVRDAPVTPDNTAAEPVAETGEMQPVQNATLSSPAMDLFFQGRDALAAGIEADAQSLRSQYVNMPMAEAKAIVAGRMLEQFRQAAKRIQDAQMDGAEGTRLFDALVDLEDAGRRFPEELQDITGTRTLLADEGITDGEIDAQYERVRDPEATPASEEIDITDIVEPPAPDEQIVANVAAAPAPELAIETPRIRNAVKRRLKSKGIDADGMTDVELAAQVTLGAATADTLTSSNRLEGYPSLTSRTGGKTPSAKAESEVQILPGQTSSREKVVIAKTKTDPEFQLFLGDSGLPNYQFTTPDREEQGLAAYKREYPNLRDLLDDLRGKHGNRFASKIEKLWTQNSEGGNPLNGIGSKVITNRQNPVRESSDNQYDTTTQTQKPVGPPGQRRSETQGVGPLPLDGSDTQGDNQRKVGNERRDQGVSSGVERGGEVGSGVRERSQTPDGGGVLPSSISAPLKPGDAITFTANVPGAMTPIQGVVKEIKPNGSIVASANGINYPNAQIVGDARQQPAVSDTPVARDLQRLGIQDGTAAFLRNVIERGPKEYRTIARILAAFTLPNPTLVDLPDANYAGAFVASTRQIRINVARRGPRGPVDTVMHELIHAALEDSLRNPTDAQQKILNRLERIRQTVIKRAEAIGNRDVNYGLSSMDEFFTHFLTSPEFQRQIGAMTPKGQRNWVEVIMDAMRSLFGAKVKTATDKSIEAIWNDMIRFTRSAAEEQYGPHARTTDGRVLLLPAYHGTPHKVDKFSLSKIGTGEGAQAYGWGLYFTETMSVAEGYRKKLSKEGEGNLYTVEILANEDEMLDWDKPMSDQPVKIQDAIQKANLAIYGRFAKPLRPTDSGAELYSQVFRMTDVDTEYAPSVAQERTAALRASGIKGIRFLDGQSRNRPYKEIKRGFLDALPENAEFDDVRDAIDGDAFTPTQTAFLKALEADDWFGFDYPAQAISAALSDRISNWDPSPELLASIEPLRGNATYNYVIFDENDIQITEENGKPVTATQATAPDPGPYGIARMDQLLMQPADLRDLSRFKELSEMDSRTAEQEAELVRMQPAVQATDPFYSQLQRTVAAKVPARATPEQIMATVKAAGVKAEEIKWSGIEQALGSLAVDGKVEKAALMKYLGEEGSVRFEEVVNGKNAKDVRIDNLPAVASLNNGMFQAQMADGTPLGMERRSQADAAYDLRNSQEYIDALNKPYEDTTKFGQYVLPGGENYREVVLAMPNTKLTKKQFLEANGITEERWNAMDATEKFYWDGKHYIEHTTAGYTSTHFPDVPNYVAHMRTNERDGGLFIEELQSDRHQAGRKQGYKGEIKPKEGWTAEDGAPRGYPGSWFVFDETGKRVMDATGVGFWTAATAQDAILQASNKGQEGIADAPFRTTWPLALFKRALRDAVAGGKEWIGWTVGETQNDRFDLSKQVSILKWTKQPNGDVALYAESKDTGAPIINGEAYPVEKLPDVIGKGLADQISEQISKGYEIGDFEGDGLKVGGSGMKGFYDNMLPKEIGKYVKQWGGKVEKGEVVTMPAYSEDPEGFPDKKSPIWRIDITPAMREGVSQGQPLFQPVSEPATPDTLRETAIGFLPDGFTLDDLDINFDQLAEDVSDTDPVNAEELIRSAVNYEVAKVAAERELGDDYDPMFAETYYKLLSGNLPDADKAFYIGNPTAMDRLIRFLTSALRRLTTAIQLQFDRHTATAVNRISRALVDAERGFKVRPDYVMMGGDVTRFLFAGENAQMDQFRRESLDTARAMAAAGKTSEEIRAVTGWFPGKYDGKMRWEIPDKGATIVDQAAFSEKAVEVYGGEVFSSLSFRSVFDRIQNGKVLRLNDVLDHPDLYAAYPEAAEIPFFPIGGNIVNGSLRTIEGQKFITATFTTENGRISEQSRSVILHEVQHFIQDVEGFAKGGSPDGLISRADIEDAAKFKDAYNALNKYKQQLGSLVDSLANERSKKKGFMGFGGPDGGVIETLEAEVAKIQNAVNSVWEYQKKNLNIDKDSTRASLLSAINAVDNKLGSSWVMSNRNAGLDMLYKSLAGEIEARDVQARANMTPEQLAATAPYSSENIAPEDSIVRFQPVTGPDNRVNHYQDVYLNDPQTQGSAAAAEPRNWFQRMFVDRDDLARPLSKLFLNKTFTKRATEEQLKRIARDYNLIQKQGAVDPDLVSRTLGSNKPTLTKADADRINAENAERLADLWAQESAAISARESAKDEQLKAARSAFLRAGKADPSNLGAQETEYRRRSREINDKARTDIAAISADYRTRREQAMEARNKAITDARLARVAEMRRDRDLALQELEKISPPMVDWALSVRRWIDEAQDVVKSVYGDSPDLQMVIDATKGVYLVRTYRIHQDPGYAEKFLTDPKYRKAYSQLINYFEDQLVEAEKERLRREQGEAPFEISEDEITNSRVKNKAEKLKRLTRGENISDADIEAIARKNVIEEAKIMAEDWIMGHGDSQTLVSQKSGNTIKVDFTRFLEKKDLAPELLEALGEITDPLFNATNTISSLATIAQNRKFLAAYVKTGKEIGNLITKEEYESNPSKYRGWDVLVAKDERSPAYAPLAGYYAPPEHILAFKAVINQGRTVPSSTADKAFDRVNRTIMGAAGTSLAVVVMGNPASAVRNVVGGSLLASRQGIVAAMTAPFTKKGRTAFRTVYEAVFDPKTRRVSDEKINKYVAQGVILNGVNTNHLREMYEQYGSDENTFLDKVQEFVAKGSVNAADKFSKTRKGTSTVFEYIGKIWEFSETLYNVIVYENELAKLQAAEFGTEQQMEQEAADRMRMLMPSHSEQSQGVRGLTGAPVSALIAPFIRFKTDMIRTTVNTYKLAIRDMKSGNPELVKAGQQRLASAFAIDAVLTAVVPQILQGLMGIGDDEDRAIRSAMPDYAKNSNFYYSLDRETGELTTWDLTYLNPMSFVMDPFVNMYRAVASGNPEEIPAIAASSVGQEFLGENVLAGLVIDVKRNKDDTTGKSIYLETDSDAEKIRKSLAHIVGGAYTPAVGKVLYRTYDAATRDQEADQFFFTPIGQAANLFLPVKPRAQFVQDMAYRSFSETRAMNAQLWQTMSASRSPRPMDSSEIADMYEDRVQGTVRVWGEFYEHAKGFEALGMTRSEILATARRAGLSQDRTRQVLTRGTTDRPVESAEAMEKMGQIDPDRVRVLREEQNKRARHLDVTGK